LKGLTGFLALPPPGQEDGLVQQNGIVVKNRGFRPALFFWIVVGVFLAPRPILGADVTLAWEPSVGATSYRLHYGPLPGCYTATQDAGNSLTHTLTGLEEGVDYYIAVTAYDATRASAFSNEVLFNSGGELLTAPHAPLGISSGSIGGDFLYSTGGTVSNYDHQVQYRFHWGNGTHSEWLPVGTTSAEGSWSSAGIYSVQVEARCANHRNVLSVLSAAKDVFITPGHFPVEKVRVLGSPVCSTAGVVDCDYLLFAGTAYSSAGHDIEVRFSTGDGAVTEWQGGGAVIDFGSWSLPGTYSVQMEARCAVHKSALSGWSVPAVITIADVGVCEAMPYIVRLLIEE